MFLSTAVTVALLFGASSATPVANYDYGRDRGFCGSEANVLRSLKSLPSSQASSFCSSFLQSTTSVTSTQTELSIVATETTTPPVVVITETFISSGTITATVDGPVLYKRSTIAPSPSDLSKFGPSRISSACSCLITPPAPVTSTIFVTVTVPVTLTTTAAASTTTTTTTDSVVATVTTTISVQPTSTKIIVNGSFESGLSGWNVPAPTGDYSVNPSSSGHRGSGAASIKCNAATSPPPPLALEQRLNTAPAITYDVSFYASLASTAQGPYYVFVYVGGTSIIPAQVTSTWQQFKGSFTARSYDMPLQVFFSCGGPGTIALDEFVVTRRA